MSVYRVNSIGGTHTDAAGVTYCHASKIREGETNKRDVIELTPDQAESVAFSHLELSPVSGVVEIKGSQAAGVGGGTSNAGDGKGGTANSAHEASDGLDALTKKQLHELAEANGVAVEGDANKATIVDALRRAGVKAA